MLGDVWPPMDEDEDGGAQDQEGAIISLEDEELSQEIEAFIGELILDNDRNTRQMESTSENMAGTIDRDGVEEKD
jgi:hypothetical protein